MAFEHLSRRIGTYKGKPVYRIAVRVLLNDSRSMSTVATQEVLVTAHSANDAADYVKKEWMHRPETEIFAYGPKGGTAHRFVSWEASIGHELMQPRSRNAHLPFPEE